MTRILVTSFVIGLVAPHVALAAPQKSARVTQRSTIPERIARSRAELFRADDLARGGKPRSDEDTIRLYKKLMNVSSREWQAGKAPTAPKQPAVYAAGVAGTVVAVNGKSPGFTVPDVMANAPLFNMWASMWGFTRVE